VANRIALFRFVLHADLEPGSILQDLTVIAQVDIESVDFRHPQVPDGFRGFQDRGNKQPLPCRKEKSIKIFVSF
jgi:hypothetical protein